MVVALKNYEDSRTRWCKELDGLCINHNVADGQTDGRMNLLKQYRALRV